MENVVRFDGGDGAERVRHADRKQPAPRRRLMAEARQRQRVLGELEDLLRRNPFLDWK